MYKRKKMNSVNREIYWRYYSKGTYLLIDNFKKQVANKCTMEKSSAFIHLFISSFSKHLLSTSLLYVRQWALTLCISSDFSFCDLLEKFNSIIRELIGSASYIWMGSFWQNSAERKTNLSSFKHGLYFLITKVTYVKGRNAQPYGLNLRSNNRL